MSESPRAQISLPGGATLHRLDPADPLPPEFGRTLPDHVLDRIASHWAGQHHVAAAGVILREEALGWAIWAPGHPQSYATFVDKVTGRVAHFRNPNFPDRQYAQQLEHEDGLLPRPGYGGPEVDPPAVVAQVSLSTDGRHYPRSRGVSARTGPPPVLHPVVAARLAAVPRRARVRGSERHAELLALGAALEAADSVRARNGLPRITAADLDGPGVRVVAVRHLIRDPGDPRTGVSGSLSCATCAAVLGSTRSGTPAARIWERVTERARLHLGPAEPLGDLIAEVSAVEGVTGRHRASPAAVRALRGYLGKSWAIEMPGRRVRTAGFHIDPRAAADSADTLARVAGLLGVPLFPVGIAGPDGIIAIDPRGRVYLIDESGEWSLGRGLRRALDTLLLGRSAVRVPTP
jgi:hypothetical protein